MATPGPNEVLIQLRGRSLQDHKTLAENLLKQGIVVALGVHDGQPGITVLQSQWEKVKEAAQLRGMQVEEHY